MQEVRDAGWADHFGLTGIGDADALRFVLSQPEITSVIVGFGSAEHVLQAVRTADLEPLPNSKLKRLETQRILALEQSAP